MPFVFDAYGTLFDASVWVQVDACAARIADQLDAVLSVDALRVYKPRPEVYALVTEAFAHKPADVVFVSSNRWDVMGAAAFGFRTAWVNRSALPDEYAGPPASTVLSDLSGLAAMPH